MEKNKLIIIALIAVIAVLAVSVGYALLFPHIEYQKISLSNGTSIEVPKADDVSWTKDINGIRTYTCPSKHTVVTSFNSQEDSNLVGAGGFAIARDLLLDGSKDVETYNNYQIKENTVNGTHYYMVYVSNNETHDNILIGSDNLDILKHMLDSLILGQPGEAADADLEQSSVPTPTNTSSVDENKYSEDDLILAAQYGYYTGYSDGYDDSYYYNSYNDYNDYDYNDYDSSSSADSYNDNDYYNYEDDDY